MRQVGAMNNPISNAGQANDFILGRLQNVSEVVMEAALALLGPNHNCSVSNGVT
jgi:hypothetical protein